MEPILKSFKSRIERGEINPETFSIFYNNFRVALIEYLGAIFFGIIPLSVLMINGLFIGYVGTQYDLLFFLAGTIPHGIFEIPGLIIASAGGLVLFHFLFLFLKDILLAKNNDLNDYKNNKIKNKIKYSLNKNLNKFKQSLILFACSLILLFIAAIIESNLTLSIANYILNLNWTP
jgi:uncharacterized membrane protein SpoIIM required for sporulation